MTFAVIVLNAAYVALLASTFTRTFTWLRIALVTASVAFIIYGVVEAILSMVLWNVGIGGMHLSQLIRDHRQQKSVSLSDPEKTMRNEFFPGMSDFDFHLLWCMGQTIELDDEVVIERGTIPETVSLVLDGMVVIERHGETLRGLRRGALVGEISFVSGQPADVTVVAHGHVVLRQWDQRQLTSLDRLHPTSFRAFEQLIARDLAAKARV